MIAVKTSVVIPVGSGLAGLEYQLAALEEQTLAVAVVLSANAAISLPILEGLAPNFSCVTKIVDSTEVRGPSFARMNGAQQAEGEHVLYCDADDVVSPTWAELLVNALGDAELVGGSLDYGRLNSPDLASWQHDWAKGPAEKWDYMPFLPSANIGIRRSVLDEIGGWDMALRAAEDTDLCWRVQLAGYRMTYVPNAVVHYRLRETPASAYRQSFGYGIGDAALMRKYRGVARRSIGKSVVDAAGTLASIRRISTRDGQIHAAAKFGATAGRVLGSARERVWVV